ncbi:hypothetical protein IMZ48_06500 [Candidatus Bathyarchaeota archaeon]|nr:hypothetical protein [Candidatus Bathyarchaeota archaeon]
MAFRDSASSHPNPSVLSDHDPPPASNAAELTNLRERATALLRSCPQAPDEATQGVLLAAVKHLPLDGRVTLMREIVLLGEDWDALRQLGRFIIDAVLKPSMSSALRANGRQGKC